MTGKKKLDAINAAADDMFKRLSVLKDSRDQVMALVGTLTNIDDDRRLAMLIDAYAILTEQTHEELAAEIARGSARGYSERR